jgi:hypothetical protein
MSIAAVVTKRLNVEFQEALLQFFETSNPVALLSSYATSCLTGYGFCVGLARGRNLMSFVALDINRLRWKSEKDHAAHTF